MLRQHARGAVVYALTLGLTDGVAVGPAGPGPRTRRARSSSPCSSSPGIGATVTRYMALRSWVFARGQRTGALRRLAMALDRADA